MGCINSTVVAPEPPRQKAWDHEGDSAAAAPRSATAREYMMGEVLGQGSFGVVYAAKGKSTGEAVAVKVVELLNQRPLQRSFAQAEVEMWRSVGSHPNVVELRESFTEMQRLFIVMEECQGSLIEWLCDEFDTIHERMPWIMREMLLGIQACHQSGVVHRDIKPENFLVSMGGARIKLSDFGLAAKLPSKGGLRGSCGTRPMMSPEMLSGKRYGTATDMWSFGVTAYIVLFGEMPFNPKGDTHEAMRVAVMKGRGPRWMHEELFSGAEVYQQFLRSLLRREPRHRASADQALEHAFLRAISHPGEQTAKQGGNKQADTEETLAPIGYSDVLASLDYGDETWSVGSRFR